MAYYTFNFLPYLHFFLNSNKENFYTSFHHFRHYYYFFLFIHGTT